MSKGTVDVVDVASEQREVRGSQGSTSQIS
jgi:hypothetical protein